MILVIEPDPDYRVRLRVRVVLDPGENPPSSLLDIRAQLRLAAEDLPSSIEQILIIPDRRRP